MPVEAGDTVEAGQPIIGFNLETLESENQRAELNVRSGQLSLQMPSNRRQTLRQNRKRLRPGSRSWRHRSQRNRPISGLQQQITEAQSQAAADAQAAAQQAAQEAAQAYEAAVAQAEQEYQQAKEEYDTVTLRISKETGRTEGLRWMKKMHRLLPGRIMNMP